MTVSGDLPDHPRLNPLPSRERKEATRLREQFLDAPLGRLGLVVRRCAVQVFGYLKLFSPARIGTLSRFSNGVSGQLHCSLYAQYGL